MEPVVIVAALALLQLLAFSYRVGAARVKYGIKAPATSGHPEFERHFRVHQNSLEQIVIFLPALWMFGWYVNPLVGAALGILFIVGRFVYRLNYLKDPSTRAAGFVIGLLATVILLAGGVIGAMISWI